MNTYKRFLTMIGTSTVAMFGLMYLNTYALNHVYWSENRMYMALYMGSMMAIVMLAFMLRMYPDKIKNLAIFACSAVIFCLGVFLMRSQATVQDQSWMQAMIPHHSIAVLTSKRAEIKDVRVRKLANEIIKAQRREIKEMKWLINDIKDNGEATTQEKAANRPVPTFEGNL